MPSAKTSPIRARTIERQKQALELRRMGLGYEAIAAQIGIGKSQAHRLVAAGMDDAREQIAADADVLRAAEVSRLDGMLQGLWPRARKGDVAAVDRVLKIGERRAKLLGLDAPTKIAETDPDGNAVGPRVIELVPGGRRSAA